MKLTRTLAIAATLALIGGIPVASPAMADETITCDWRDPEYPHVSSHNFEYGGGKRDIKTSTQGTCNPTVSPVAATATMTLEKQVFAFFWSTVATGPAITKDIQGTGAVWKRNELMAVLSPCVSGVYRGRLHYSWSSPAGVVIPINPDKYSPAVNVDCKTRRTSLVVDDTGSMGGVIGSVKSALNSYIAGQPEDEYTRWSLTTFKDSPYDVGTTTNRSEIVNWVNALTASGGGDCPEDVLGGISSGLAALGTDPDSDKQMIVATDASAQSGDVDGIIASARSSGVRVNVLLTGDCGAEAAASTAKQGGGDAKASEAAAESSQVVLKRIAQETGGKYFFLPDGNTDDFTGALKEIFADFVDIAPPPSGSPPVSPAPPGSGLPVTGQSLITLIGAGLALVAAGVWLVFWSRRRRSIHG